MAFLPDDYEPPAPQGGHYFKPAKGETSRVRVVGNAITGYLGWDKTGASPIPRRAEHREQVAQYHTGEDKVKHFWAFSVLHDGAIKIWEVTQASIRDQISALVDNADWGDPTQYDIMISRSGEGLDTSYSVMPAPKSPPILTAEQQDAVFKLRIEALFTNDDPFGGTDDDGDDIPNF